MIELKVPLLDLYEATYLSSDQLYPSDGRHYKPDMNRKMLGWFYGQQDVADAKEHIPKFFDQVSTTMFVEGGPQVPRACDSPS